MFKENISHYCEACELEVKGLTGGMKVAKTKHTCKDTIKEWIKVFDLDEEDSKRLETLISIVILKARDEGFECGGDYGRKLLKQAEDKGYAEGVRLTEKKYQETGHMKLDYLKMLEEINELVNNDFSQDMECKLIPNSGKYTQEQAEKMAKIISKVYSIAHCIYCKPCQARFLI